MKKTKRLLSLLTSTAIAASAFSALVIPASAEDTLLTFNPTVDTYVDKDNPDTANADATVLKTGYNAASGTNGIKFANETWGVNNIAYMKYDVSDAEKSNKDIVEATLSIYATGTARGHSIWLGYTPCEAWDDTLTFNTLPEEMAVGGITNSYMNIETKSIEKDVLTNLTYDVTDYVKNDEDGILSFFIADTAAGGADIYSNENDEQYRPVLTLRWTDAASYDVTINNKVGDQVIASYTVNSVLDGTTVEATSQMLGYKEYEGVKYVPKADAQTSIDVSEGNTVLDIEFEKLDDSIVEYEDFENITGDWGFTSEDKSVPAVTDGAMMITTFNNASSKVVADDTKVFDENVSSVAKGNISFSYMSGVEALKNRTSAFALKDSDDNVIIQLFGTGAATEGLSAGVTYTVGEALYDKATGYTGKGTLIDGSSTNKWYNVSIDFDFTGETNKVSGSISNDSGVLVTIPETEVAASNIGKMVGTIIYSAAPQYIDNVVVTAEETEEPTTDPTAAPTADPTTEPTDEPDATVEPAEYLNDDFNSYETTGVTAQGNENQSAEMGNFIVAVGSRSAGGDGVSNVSLEDGAIKITSGGNATSSRGGSIALNTKTVTVPAYADLENGAQINYTFDAKFMDAASTIQLFGITSNETTSGGQVVNDPYLSVANNSHLPLGEWVTVTASVKNDKSGYVTIKNADGKIIYITEITASGDTFEKLACYGGVSTVYIDNFKVDKTAAEYGTVNVSVKTSSGEVINGATVTVDGYKLTVSESGVVSVPMPAGEYTVSAERTGYEATAGMGDADSETITVVKGGTNTVDLVLNLQEYTKLPDTVVINGGQTFISAPKTAEPSTSAAFTADVSDQMTLPMLPEEYELVWSIAPTGSETADSDVTIDSNGIVSVAQSFYTNNRIKSYDVSAAATANGRTTKVTKTIYVANSDVIYYEPTNWTAPSGERVTTTTFASATTLPEISSITFNITFGVLGADGGSQRTWAIDTDAGKLVGLQYTKDGKITAWTGWTGTSAMSGSGDLRAFTNSQELIPSYTNDTQIEVTFVVDTQNKSITVSYGDASVSLPYSIDAKTITGMSAGMYRYYSQVDVADIIITEPDQNYLAITGDVDFAKVSGQTIEREYKLVQSVIVPDEEFIWTLSGVSSNAAVTLMETEDVTFEIEAPESDTTMYAIKTVYNSDGSLNNLEIENISVTAGQTSVTVSAEDGTKVMLWNSLEKMEPIAAAQIAEYEPTEEPTTAPTEEPTGAPTNPPVTGAISISEDGILRVTDEAQPGKYTITAVSSINPAKKAELEIEIADFQQFASNEMELSGPRAYEYGTDTEGTYSVAIAVDRFGDDVTEILPEAVWTSSNTSVATITEDGHLTVTGMGTTDITATITNGTAVTVMTIPVVVADFSFVADATGNSTTIDTSTMVTSSNITGYRVTTAKSDGTMVSQNIVEDLPTTVDTTGADKAEIVPVFTYDIGDTGTKGVIGDGCYISVPAAAYNLDVTVSGSRCDIYANDQMLVNNILQAGSSATEVMNDVVINEGVARITATDFDTRNGKTSKDSDVTIKIVKSSSIVNRVPKVYVLGDSLVATYYNGGSASNAAAQTGWGQVLVNYLNDTVEVNNLSNSGVTANGLYTTAFSRVATSAQSGDYLVLESGYNDRTYDTEDVMKNALRNMIAVCEEKGVNIILVSPNASLHTYNQTVSWTSRMEAVVEETGTPYIDLSDKSWSFFEEMYGGSQDWFVGMYNVSDKLHSTYNGAMKWASVVAQGLYDLGFTSIIDTDYSYSFNDGHGNTIECTVNAG